LMNILWTPFVSSTLYCRAVRARITVVPAQHSWVALPGPFVSSLQGLDVQRPLVIRLTVIPGSGERATASRASPKVYHPAAAAHTDVGVLSHFCCLAGTPSCQPAKASVFSSHMRNMLWCF
jgi:hypothetical protein